MCRFLFLFLFFASISYSTQPIWLKDSIKIVSSFDNSVFIDGYGIVFEEGLILTSASVVYNKNRANDIVLYHMESFDEPISCLSHAAILALDDTLDIAVLKPINFTDIYCNIIPEPNFRSLNFKNLEFRLFDNVKKIPLDSGTEISYFMEQDWLNFGRVQMLFDDYLRLDKKNIFGMPLFVDNEFLGIVAKNQKYNILTHGEIVDFICDISNTTSVFSEYKSILNYCSINIK